jgi:Rieske 2Fe-2S family protein
MNTTELRHLIDRQRPGWSLEQPFYVSPEIYELERRGWLAAQWYVLGHVSEVREPSSFIVRELLGESLLLVRDTAGVLRGFYNVCRHRGSRICAQDGRAGALVCPYHGWSYRLDGSFRSAAAMPEEIDLTQLGLHPVPVREIGGIILGSLSADPAALDEVQQTFEPGLTYLGIPNARIAARRSYPTDANWKLAMENFVECYHCFPCHPEYCSVMGHVDLYARDLPGPAAAWTERETRWFQEEADRDSPIPEQGFLLTRRKFSQGRGPIGAGRKTQSKDGQPVAPFLGKQRRFDGGASGFGINPFVFLQAMNDHAVLFQFLPRGVERTDVLISWLVDGTASEADVDVPRMVWMWDVTTMQDKAIIERNAAGVRSRAYTPGPYSKLESGTAGYIKGYLDELRSMCARPVAA